MPFYYLERFGNAIKLLRTSKSINENLLVTVSCIGAYLVGEHLEGLMVIILYEIGKILGGLIKYYAKNYTKPI